MRNMFQNVEEAIYWIENIKRFSKRTSLFRMEKCLEILGNPHLAYRKIHVAGTNGKGSTSAYLTSILSEYGLKVGRFVSPYIIKFHERIAVGNEYISDIDLLNYANRIYDLTELMKEKYDEIVTFFEVITLIGFLYFRDQKVEFAVIEVGLGGLLDATNVINADVSIITNIGLDHMNALGNTVEEIAVQKLGILKENNVLFTTVQPELREQFQAYCDERNVKITFVENTFIKTTTELKTDFLYEGEQYRSPLFGVYQKDNASLAIATIKYLFPEMTHAQLQKGLDQTFWPGRMEVMGTKPLQILDGAHNVHGVKGLMDSLEGAFPNKKIRFIFTAMKDKNTGEMLSMLSTKAKSITLTHFEYHRVKELEELVAETDFPETTAFETIEEAVSYVLSISDIEDIIVMTGSLYFVSELRKLYKKTITIL